MIKLPGMNLDWANGLAVVWEMQPGRYDLATVTGWLNERFSPMAVIHKGELSVDQEALYSAASCETLSGWLKSRV